MLTVVAHDDGVRLKYAGWIPQDDDSDVTLLLSTDERHCRPRSNRVVAPRFSADWFTHRANIRINRPAKSLWLSVYMVASDQHQPDNSRATATLATRGFFFRSVKPCHLP